MHAGTRSLSLLMLVAGLAACAQTPPPAAAVVEASEAAAAAPMMPRAPTPAPAPTTSAADAGLAIAIAREGADRAVREQTLRVQKQLRDQEREWARAREAAQRGDGSERCLDGQKMRRVANGWVQAGAC